jgi:hypothetical protein
MRAGHEPPLVRPILHRLRRRAHADLLVSREVRDGPRHAHGTVDGSCAHPAAVHGVGDEPASRLIQRAAFCEAGHGQRSIQAPALTLTRPRREHARAHDGTRVTARSRLQLARGERRYRDLNINPIQHRPAHLRVMLYNISWRAAAAASRMPEPAALAPLRCLSATSTLKAAYRVCSQGVIRLPQARSDSESASGGWIWA